MDYSKNPSLRLYMSSFWWALFGIAVLYLYPGRIGIYVGVSAAFLWGCVSQARTILSTNKPKALTWLSVGLATFCGDVVSTIVASGFSYENFVELERNTVVVASVDPDNIVLSGLALIAVKLFVHLWTFSSPAVWSTIADAKPINRAELASVTFWQHFKYTRFTYAKDSWRALRGKPVESRPELEFMTFVGARYLAFIWGWIYALVTVNNLFVMLLVRSEMQSLLVLHRVLFFGVVSAFLSADTVSFFLARNALHGSSPKASEMDSQVRGVDPTFKVSDT